MYYSVLSTRVRDDDPHIDEWVRYHLAIGFDFIVIYDNMSFIPVVNKWGNKVMVYKDENEYQVYPPYDTHAFLLKNHPTRWLAHLDVDEFIVLYQHASINDLLKNYEEFGGLGINWCIYGSSGHLRRPDGLVKDNYLWRTANEYIGEEGGNCAVKTIMNIQFFHGVTNPHYCVSSRPTVNEEYTEVINGSTNSPRKLCRINHYYTRSLEEWLFKVHRGNGSNFGPRTMNNWTQVQINSTIYDPILKDFQL
jgi:hypothetical protein